MIFYDSFPWSEPYTGVPDDPIHVYRSRKKRARSGNEQASAESETQVEDLSQPTTTTSSSMMQTAAPPPPIKLGHVIPPRAASFKNKNKNHLTKKKNKKLVKAKAKAN